MNDFIFRGKHRGEWVYGDLIHESSGLISIYNTDEYEGGTRYSVDPKSVGMFTGALDANNTKIFDGDIIYSQRWNRKMLVIWNGESLQWKARYIDSEYSEEDLGWVIAEPVVLGTMTTKIVGNKYDEDMRIVNALNAVGEIQSASPKEIKVVLDIVGKHDMKM